MSYATRFIKAVNAQEGLLVLAEGIDEILAKLASAPPPALDPWNVGGEWAAHDEAGRIRVDSAGNEDGENVVHLPPPPSDARRQQRRQFERQNLRIAEYKGETPDEPGVNWTEAYAQGGPLWLYHGNRDLVMAQPLSTRQAMVTDLIEEGFLTEAHEMSADILKHDFEVPDVSAGDGALAIGDSA